jgi:DNA-binding PadR family transcriptional regulator
MGPVSTANVVADRPPRHTAIANYIRYGYSADMNRRESSAQTPLTPAVLHILLALAEGERHGYAIAQEIETTTEGEIRMGPGTLYGSIRRMLGAGLIDESPAPKRRRPDDDERRRYYKMTPLGRRLLEAELSRLTRVVRVARGKRVLRDPGVA